MLRGWVGNLGSGKTYGMVNQACLDVRRRPSHEAPRIQCTNMADLAFPMSIYAGAFTDMQRVADGVILLDEAGVWMDARSWQSIPATFLQRLVQLRHVGVDLYYTAQGFEQVDSRLRLITNYTERCVMITIGRGLFITCAIDPRTKGVVHWRMTPFDTKIAALYNTMEVVGDPKTGKGRKYRRSTRISRQADPFIDRRDWGTETTPIEELLHWRGGNCEVSWSKDEEITKQYLYDLGLYAPGGQQHRQMWEYALRRTRWLAMFRIHPHEVPFWMSKETPWVVAPPVDLHNQVRILGAPTFHDVSDEDVDRLFESFWRPRYPFVNKCKLDILEKHVYDSEHSVNEEDLDHGCATVIPSFAGHPGEAA